MRRASGSATLPAPPLDAEAAERRREYRSHGKATLWSVRDRVSLVDEKRKPADSVPRAVVAVAVGDIDAPNAGWRAMRVVGRYLARVPPLRRAALRATPDSSARSLRARIPTRRAPLLAVCQPGRGQARY